jgi:hypothetical protein
MTDCSKRLNFWLCPLHVASASLAMSALSPNTAFPVEGRSAVTKLCRFGFVFGRSSAHAARTMMLKELGLLLQHMPADSRRTEDTD